eukprot:scaffold36180_cov48-Phaeocystis_antarctica.AAC.1
MSWKCLAMSVASTAPMIDLRASLNCTYVWDTLCITWPPWTAARPSRQASYLPLTTHYLLLAACCLLLAACCLLLTTYLLPPTCYLPLVEALKYGAVGPEQEQPEERWVR